MFFPRLSLSCIIVFCVGGMLRAEPIDFDRDIRPILSENCFHCHGPDAEAREADLRLDTQEGILGDQGGYQIVAAGKLNESELYRRIRSQDNDVRMPPTKSGLELTEKEKGAIQRWIEEGAVWAQHWAYESPKRSTPPAVKAKDWPLNEIDRFVLSRLEIEGLAPSPQATQERLIRRVTLDLTGLPPTPEEVDAFLADDSADAYEKVVDGLLKSSRYGERMAWEWLDAARYADTDGFQGDPTRTMWPWRDWLIKALNNNMPFDQFTIEMLAGDLLPDASLDQIIATGFNRNHMHNGEGGRIADETRVENVFDRTETTSTVWLGLTMTCCRCHDHKYDPITQQEYYQLYAFFNNTSENGGRGGGKAPPTVKFQSEEQRQQLKLFDQRIAELKKKLERPMPDVERAQLAWEVVSAKQLETVKDAGGKLGLSPWSVLGTVPAPDGNSAKTFEHEYGPEKGVDLEREYSDGQIVWREETKFADGKVHPLPDTVGATYLYRTLDSPGPRTIDVSLGSDDGIKVWLNGKQVLSKNAARAAAPDQEKLTLKLLDGKNELLLKIVNTGGIAGFYFKKIAESIGGLTPEIAAIIAVDPTKRTAVQQNTIRDFFRSSHSDDWKILKSELSKIEQQRQTVDKSAVTVMVMDDLPANKKRTTNVLLRGIYNKPTEQEVSVGTPAFLPPLPKGVQHNRLALAQWIVDPSNPLTARVTVNRYWQMFFGTGLVKTSEDFGRQGSRPSHPKLLDWLATRFIESGWDVKEMHKLIVMSATYQQSSRMPTSHENARSNEGYVDHGNRLLSRGSRYRMPSWMLRDQALAVSGLLDDTIGGPSIKPYQPEGVWAEATFGKIRYQPDQGDSLYRRSLYIFWRRIVGPTMLFDGGKRQTCEVKPTRTNTPLHALTTLNETTFVEASRLMAECVLKSKSDSPEERISQAFRLATAREPQADELLLLVRRWRQFKDMFESNAENADKLLSVGQSPRDSSLNKAEHAAYAVICSLILNLDEVISRE